MLTTLHTASPSYPIPMLGARIASPEGDILWSDFRGTGAWPSTVSTSASSMGSRRDWSALFNLTDGDLSERLQNADRYVTKDESFRLAVAALVISAAVLGGIVNLFVLSLSFGPIRGDYRQFIANLALVDVLCCALFAFMGHVNLIDRRRFSPSLITYSALAFYGSFGVMVCALAPVSLSRVVAAAQPRTYDRMFAGRRALFMCLLFDGLPVSLLAGVCLAEPSYQRWLFFSYALLTVAAYLVAFVSNFFVFRIVASHIRVVECLHDRTRLLETRQVAIATLAQALIPLVCQVPAFLTLSSALLLTEPITDGRVIVVTQLWLAASPLFDALITIFVIKQYRIQTLACCSCSSRSITRCTPSTNGTTKV